MTKLLFEIGNEVCNVLHFSGRTKRRNFWIYAGFVTAAVALLTILAILPPYSHRAMHGARSGYDLSINAIIWPTAVVAAIWMALLAAATVRRLNDGGRSRLWAALPLPFLAMA